MRVAVSSVTPFSRIHAIQGRWDEAGDATDDGELPQLILGERIQRRYAQDRSNLWKCAYLNSRLWYPTPQVKALSVPFSFSAPDAVSSPIKHCPTWPTSLATPTERCLCDLRENFDPRSRWRSAISAARICRGSRKVMVRTNPKRTS